MCLSDVCSVNTSDSRYIPFFFCTNRHSLRTVLHGIYIILKCMSSWLNGGVDLFHDGVFKFPSGEIAYHQPHVMCFLEIINSLLIPITCYCMRTLERIYIFHFVLGLFATCVGQFAITVDPVYILCNMFSLNISSIYIVFICDNIVTQWLSITSCMYTHLNKCVGHNTMNWNIHMFGHTNGHTKSLYNWFIFCFVCASLCSICIATSFVYI